MGIFCWLLLLLPVILIQGKPRQVDCYTLQSIVDYKEPVSKYQNEMCASLLSPK